jgi:hypothetical protein
MPIDDLIEKLHAECPPAVVCGRCAESYGRKHFNSLQLFGYLGDSRGRRIETRYCPCGSTVSVDVEVTSTPADDPVIRHYVGTASEVAAEMGRSHD